VLPRNDIAGSVRSWQIGGVGGASFDAVGQALPFLAVGFVVSLLSARSLNSLALGDEVAAGLGERVAIARGIAALGAVLLCGAATAIAGPIAFVGLVVPHLCRMLIGVDNRWLLPFSALTGAGLLTAADILGRIVARPSEIDVGIITALIGAPFFIYIVRRQKIRELGPPPSIPPPPEPTPLRRTAFGGDDADAASSPCWSCSWPPRSQRA
jgi:iron complex transport system permease protein